VALALTIASAAAGPVNWAHQAAGAVQSNGAVTVRSLSGGAYSATTNPSGAVARINQNAATQPPTVLLKGRSKAYRANGASCVYPHITPSDDIDVYYEVDKTKKMDCWTDYPYAGTWRIQGTTAPCFVGMTKSYRATFCALGGAVQASLTDSTVIGRYVGTVGPQPGGVNDEDMIVDLADLPAPARWGCYGGVPAYTTGTYFDYGPLGGSGQWADASVAGSANTRKIREIMTTKSECTSTGESAAMLCYAKGPAWFLPAPQQLAVLASKRSALGGFSNAKYWTSAENGPNNSNGALGYDFATNATVALGKSSAAQVRCVRTF